MNFIESITTNIQSPDGNDYTVQLGPRTILIGDNEAGKSAITRALELTRVGTATGLLYRDSVKDGTLLSELIPHGQEHAFAEATLGSGEKCQWTLERGSRPVRSGPNGAILSTLEISNILKGSPETSAKFLWSKLVRRRPPTALLNWLDEEFHHMIESMLDPAGDDWSDLINRIGKRQRTQSAAIKSSRVALESLGSIRKVSDDELDGILDQLNRVVLRDLVRSIYLEYKADPGLQASHVLEHLVGLLGGQNAIERIPDSEGTRHLLADALLHRRLSKIAVAAKRGEKNANVAEREWKDLKSEVLQAMMNDINVREEAAEFVKRASGFLPKGEDLYLKFEDGKLRCGIRKGMTATDFGTLHTALSGSTEARVVAAMAAALAAQCHPDEALIVVDDRMWDATTLASTLRCLAGCKAAQVVVMSTLKPKGKKRGDWRYIYLSRTEGDPLGVIHHA